MHRKSTVKESLSLMKPKKKKQQPRRRLRGRYLFRAATRRIWENFQWIKQEIDQEENVEESKIPLIVDTKKTADKQILSTEDRSFLLSQPYLRSKEDKFYLVNLIKTLGAFKKYPEDIRELMAAVCNYQYLGPDRIIVRQGHPARNLYYIIEGKVSLTKVEKDSVTGDESEVNAGTMGPRDIFGEVALLLSLPRAMTITTKSKDIPTTVELLFITKSDFDEILRDYLMKNWNLLQEALIAFEYFKNWDEATIRECCVLSKIKDFGPNEILLGDGKGMVNFVHFLISGRCRLIEHMMIQQRKHSGQVKYQLYVPKPIESSSQSSNDTLKKDEIDEGREEAGVDEDYTDKLSLDCSEDLDANKRIKAVTSMLQDIINQFHRITGIAELSLEKTSKSVKLKYPENVKPFFMQVCEFTKGACFGLGERMENRRIVTITSVRCLLIPRYWLFEHNRANIWKRAKLFLNSKYPTREELLKKLIANRKWIEYKNELVDEIIKRGRHIHNNTTIYDVPYSIRMNEKVDSQ